MTRSLYAIPAVLCLATAVLTGQAPAGDKGPTTNPSSSHQPSSTMAGNKATYVGCLKPGTSNGTWVLENAEAQKTGAAGAGAVGTSGGSKMSLNLHPAATVNLKAHANHKVELVGVMADRPGATAPAEPKGGEAAAGVTGPTDAKGEAGTPPAAAAGAERTGVAGAKASQSHFSVESLKMMSGTCP